MKFDRAWLAYFEPARLRAFYVALVLLLGVVGFHFSADIDAKVTGFLAALAVLVPAIQGEFTRLGVVSPATADGVTRADVTSGAVPSPGTPHDSAYDPLSDPSTTPGVVSGVMGEPPVPADGSQDGVVQ